LSEDNRDEEQIGTKYYVHAALSGKGRAFLAKYATEKKKELLESALTAFELAERLLSKQQSTIDRDESRWKFIDANYNIYEHIISTLFELKAFVPEDSIHRKVFSYFERSRPERLPACWQKRKAQTVSTSRIRLFAFKMN
jgi:hypothetical protein